MHIALTITLRQFRSHKTIFLLRIGITDKTFLCLEVECHGICLIGIVTHLEHRSTKFQS